MPNDIKGLAKLVEAVDQMRSEEGFQKWLQSRRRFHAYSLRNTILIALQRPYRLYPNDDVRFTAEHCTQVMGFAGWKKLNRKVMKYSKGIVILAPHPYRIKKEHRLGPDDDGQRLGFHDAYVFDVSQTLVMDGKPDLLGDPPIPEPITGNSHAHLVPELVAHAETVGTRVQFKDLSRLKEDGWHDPVNREIVVNSEAPANRQVRILVHELVHAHGVGYDAYTRSVAEQIADAGCYLACAELGLDVSAESVPYIAGWAKAEPPVIEEQARVISSIAEIIVEAVKVPEKAAA